LEDVIDILNHPLSDSGFVLLRGVGVDGGGIVEEETPQIDLFVLLHLIVDVINCD
jgi:hypothetical protein